jgi:hypothetical protein
MKNFNTINLILVSVLFTLIGIMLGVKYQQWHQSKLYIPPNITEESFDMVISEFYVNDYCRGMPMKHGIFKDTLSGSAYNFEYCGLRKIMYKNHLGQFLFFEDARDGTKLSVIR